MKIKIFCEAGKQEGLGHLMRCWRLKKLLLKITSDVLIYQSGEEKFPMSDYHCQYLENNQIEELLEKTDIAIIDSYQAKQDIYENVSQKVKKLIVLDDTNCLAYPPNCIILNGALGAKNLYEKTQNHLAGIEFSIIDKIFFATKIPKTYIQNILITFGGTDPSNMAYQVIELIKHTPYNLHITSREPLKYPKSNKLKWYQNISSTQMARLMQKCDIAISAGGGTLNELGMSQTPTLIIPTAQNQIFQAQQWDKQGAMKISSLKNLLKDLDTIAPMETRKKMISKYSSIPFGTKLFKSLQTIFAECEK